MSAGATELRLGVAARADNLMLVRQAIAGLGDAMAIPEEAIADLKQIASEACMNAVLHAYPNGREGRIEIAAAAADGTIELRVRDWGVGFRPRPAEPEGSLRLGLPLIATVADSFEIATPLDGGTQVTARVRVGAGNGSGELQAQPGVPREAEVAITAGSPARPVIARVIAVAANRAGFTLERLSEGVLLGDAIAAGRASDFTENLIRITIQEWGPNLAVRVGPLANGGGRRLLERMELPGLDASLSKLASKIEVESDAEGEHLVIAVEG